MTVAEWLKSFWQAYEESGDGKKEEIGELEEEDAEGVRVEVGIGVAYALRHEESRKGEGIPGGNRL